MRKRIERALWMGLWAGVLSGFFALVTTDDYTASICILPVIILCAAPFGERLDRATAAYGVLLNALGVFTLAALIVLIPVVGLLGAVVTLVMFIQAYSLLRQKDIRAYYIVMLMAFFMILAACMSSPEAEIGLAMITFGLASASVFIFLHILYSSAGVTGDLEPDVVPLGGHGSQIETKPEQTWRAGFLAWQSAIVCASVVLTFVIFFITPRMEAGFLAGNTYRSPGVTTGITQSVSLSGGETIERNTLPVMIVRFPDYPGGRYDGELFWRITMFDSYTGNSWERRGGERAAVDDGIHPLDFNTLPNGTVARSPLRLNATEQVTQEIYLDPVPPTGIPALTLVQRAAAPGVRLMWDEQHDGTILAASGRSIEYSAVSEVRRFEPAELRQAPPNYARALGLAQYRHLTEQNLTDAAVTLTKEIVAGAENAYDMAIAIQQYLQSDRYAYTLDLPEMDPTHPVDDFILNKRQGHCEFFASAMALMLRSLGIPTRVVSGYRGGNFDENAGAYVVTADMAHLWVEVYFPGYGWAPFDPSLALEETEEPLLARVRHRFSRALMRAKIMWYRHVVGYNSWRLDRIAELPISLTGWIPAVFDRETGIAKPSAARRIAGTAILAVVAAVGVMYTRPGLFKRKKRPYAKRRRYMLNADQTRVARLYMIVRRRLQKTGIDCETMAAGEVAREVRARGLPGADKALELIEEYSRVRFGKRPLTRARYRELRRITRALRFKLTE